MRDYGDAVVMVYMFFGSNGWLSKPVMHIF